MAVFFQFIAGIALFIAIGAVVFMTEVSRRCQNLIAARMAEIDVDLAKRVNRQDRVVASAVREMRDSVRSLEEQVLAQSKEINILRKTLEPLNDDLEKRQLEQKKIEAYLQTRPAQRL